MTSTTIRVNQETHRKLREMSQLTGKTSQSILDAAVEQYRRHCFLQQANQAFARLKGQGGY